ncbi:hypothetical protein Dsin_023648 [Dipteronia sinensis]|uniref:DUF4283 domain-containing protein n=1 Tax=Dipteronia sinensis TaxID=43782 RepID=A0AAE0A3P3_9ROSI|nr:hypothetical protein Dsin_023648 [Dipteronia sinensis]
MVFRKDSGKETMYWGGRRENVEWLARCAVGVMKVFSDLSSVNNRLKSRDVAFMSSFLGDNFIVWSFESENERKGFINDRFLWDDCFSSMIRWCEAFVPQNRLVWGISGVPLSVWSPFFFMKVSSFLGEPLMMEEDSSVRRRLDRGRMIMLVPFDKLGSCKIQVKTDAASFTVRMEELQAPVDFNWLSNVLGLRSSFSDESLNFLHGLERLGPLSINEVCNDPSLVIMGEADICGKQKTKDKKVLKGAGGQEHNENEKCGLKEVNCFLYKLSLVKDHGKWQRARVSKTNS